MWFLVSLLDLSCWRKDTRFLYFYCVMAVFCIFLTVPWVGLKSVIVALLGHIHSLVKKCIPLQSVLCVFSKEYILSEIVSSDSI